MTRSAYPAALALLLLAFSLSAQQPAPTPDTDAKVDYARDIQPLLHANCVGCHGPTRQNGGLRLDQRSSALKAHARRIVPGSSENSFVYHRIVGEFGQPMPPTGALKPAEVALIKRWIDQGAPWPDELANDLPLPPLDPAAIALVAQLRTNDISGFLRTVSAHPALLNARGPEGSTPFMYAVLYTGVPTLTRLLALGADPNRANDIHATALLWAARDLDKTRLLLAHGADPNTRSDDFRTPLMTAARLPGGAPIVQLLLEHHAGLNPNPHPEGQSSPLNEAALAGDAASFTLLLDHGATVKSDAEFLLGNAIYTGCTRCVDLLVPHITDKDVYTATLQDIAFLPDLHSVRILLDHGADPRPADPLGRTALMYAAASDDLPADVVKLLLDHGADPNARSRHTNAGDAGLSVLEIAQRHGDTPVTRLLLAAGARPEPAAATPAVALNPRFRNEIRSAVADSLPRLQLADRNFSAKSGCISCHNNSLTALTVSLARSRGLPVDESTARGQLQANADYLEKLRDQLHQGFLLPVSDTFSEGILAYVLIGLHAEGYKPDLSTDAAAMHILWRQWPDGQWFSASSDTRQPLCLEHIGLTAKAMRGLQLYMPAAGAPAYKLAIHKAAQWLASAQSSNNDDRGWRVLGLAWAAESEPAVARPALAQAIRQLLATQRSDGGWADLPTMEPTAYATGKNLVALHTAGVPVTDPAYRRGVQWLLANQQQDGTWFVQTRAMAFQPAFDAGFPGGHSQWISSAATNWAAQALAYTLPTLKPTPLTASR